MVAYVLYCFETDGGRTSITAEFFEIDAPNYIWSHGILQTACWYDKSFKVSGAIIDFGHMAERHDHCTFADQEKLNINVQSKLASMDEFSYSIQLFQTIIPRHQSPPVQNEWYTESEKKPRIMSQTPAKKN